MPRMKPVCIDTRNGPVVFNASKSRSFCRGQTYHTKNVSEQEFRTLMRVHRAKVRNVPAIYGHSRAGRRYRVFMQDTGVSLATAPALVLNRRRLRTTLQQTIGDLERVGVYHDDLQPLGAARRNITVDENGKYWVIDFGKTDDRQYNAREEVNAIMAQFR